MDVDEPAPDNAPPNIALLPSPTIVKRPSPSFQGGAPSRSTVDTPLIPVSTFDGPESMDLDLTDPFDTELNIAPAADHETPAVAEREVPAAADLEVPVVAEREVPAAAERETPGVLPPRSALRRRGHMSVAGNAPCRSAALTDVVDAVNSTTANTTNTLSLDNVNVRTLPAWLEPHFEVMRTSFRGEVEDAVLADWLTLECEDEGRGAKLRAASRPKPLSSWVRAPFAVNTTPHPFDVEEFSGILRDWWTSLMPKWRIPVGRDWALGRDVPTGEKWTEVRKVGPGGVFVVLLGLSWWRSESAPSSADRRKYYSMLEDVAWVLREIVKDMVPLADRERPVRAPAVVEAPMVRKSVRAPPPPRGRLDFN